MCGKQPFQSNKLNDGCSRLQSAGLTDQLYACKQCSRNHTHSNICGDCGLVPRAGI